MNIKGQYHFPYSVETVYQTYGNPRHIEEKQRFLGSRNIDIQQCAQSEEHFQLKVVREVPAEAPAMLKKFIADWNTLIQQESWEYNGSQGYNAQLKVSIEGVPVTITGDIQLIPDGEGCTHLITLKFDCKIPIVGKKLAEFVAGKTEEAMQNEFAFVSDYLQANH
ncbi:hypothetical protein BTA51_02975 [Hahella sp. CCB-MM4]|uniref:DUF2505 domain-containing protein n=1 Tax=Hahella sp. (strain CCB-MM4) TaxID=1926491 RepID=UPI000B9B7E8E|nr:DUF2505 domain-containing protein [Hahella sp. CCB-MM4]OZG75361.1 hypothetical protein BTA51_02975 [Hahella sp. CCB-MM4]